MKQAPLFIGPFEELVLRTILRLGENAYGVTILQNVEEVTSRRISIGAIYTTLERLEAKGFISARLGDPTPQRGGRAKKYFKLKGAGLSALEEMQTQRDRAYLINSNPLGVPT